MKTLPTTANRRANTNNTKNILQTYTHLFKRQKKEQKNMCVNYSYIYQVMYKSNAEQ